MKRDVYVVGEASCTHTYTDVDGRVRTVHYWIGGTGSGYVRYVDEYGQQVQPYDRHGRTWIASSGAEIRDYCKAARRRERAVYS
jgi:hypothetical protein